MSATENPLQAQVPPEVLQLLTEQITREVVADQEVKYARALDASREKLEKAAQETLEAELDSLRKAMKPPTPEEIQNLLNGEIVSFRVPLPWEGNTREFVLQELPQSVEKKFYRLVKSQIAAKASEVGTLAMSALDTEGEGQDLTKKIMATLEAFEPTFDLLAEAAALSLNPRNEISGLDKDWIQNHLASWRIWNIVLAQVQCNRLRDFLSQLFQASSGLGTISPTGIQR